jgi:hypothetical protein
MRCLVIALFLLVAPAAILAADAAPPALEERMDEAARERTGIARLTPDELAALNAWLAAERRAAPASALTASAAAAPAAPAAPAATDERIGFRTRATGDEEPPRIESRIVGTFRGLAPRATIRLENGQVWRSVDSTVVFRGVTAESPAVEITEGAFGGWRLRLADYRGMAKVERVR